MCPGLSEQVEIIFIKWRQISIQKDTARFKNKQIDQSSQKENFNQLGIRYLDSAGGEVKLMYT
jgi:hypothetical protein